VEENDYYTDNTENSGGIGKLINKVGTGTGLISQAKELTHLVSTLR